MDPVTTGGAALRGGLLGARGARRGAQTCFPQGTDRFLGCVHGVLDVRLGGPPSEARHIRRITSALGTLNLVYP